MPVLRGTGLRVQTIVVANQNWGLSVKEISSEYEVDQTQVKEAWAFYQAHQQEIDLDLAAEQSLEAGHGSNRLLSTTQANEWPGQLRWLNDWREEERQ